MYIVQYGMYIVQYRMYTVYYGMYTVTYGMCIVHFTIWNVYCALYNMECALYNMECALYKMEWTLYSMECTLNKEFTVYIVQFSITNMLPVTYTPRSVHLSVPLGTANLSSQTHCPPRPRPCCRIPSCPRGFSCLMRFPSACSPVY